MAKIEDHDFQIADKVAEALKREILKLDPQDTARCLVVREHNARRSAAEHLYFEDTATVWFAYVLGSWKSLVATTFEDQLYYEVTYNKEKDEVYVDTYAKVANSVHSPL